MPTFMAFRRVVFVQDTPVYSMILPYDDTKAHRVDIRSAGCAQRVNVYKLPKMIFPLLFLTSFVLYKSGHSLDDKQRLAEVSMTLS